MKDQAHIGSNALRIIRRQSVSEHHIIRARANGERNIHGAPPHVSAVVVAVCRVSILPARVILSLENERFNPVFVLPRHGKLSSEACIGVIVRNHELEGMKSTWPEGEGHIAG